MTRSLESQPKPSAGPAPLVPITPTADLSGRLLGDYRILHRLGAGGMGQVYLAEQLSLQRRVALKILKPELAADPTALARFKREAQAVALVSHANIVQVYQIDSADGIQFMALEYVEGRNLGDYIARKGPPDARLALSIMRQVASALQRAGELGIVHRDIKPENILLTRKGEVKVADFGLSLAQAAGQPPVHLTQSGTTMGTPLYMSPEQVEGKPLDPRSDIYSFGVTCYHMLAGQPPFRGETAFEVALQHVRSDAPPLAAVRPDLPPDLCAMIHRMMAKAPEARFQTCRELLVEIARLREALNGVSAHAANRSGASADAGSHAAVPARATGHMPAVPAERPLVRPLRRWLPWAIAASVLLAAGGGAAFGWLRLHAATRGPSGSKEVDVPEPRPPQAETEREKFLQTAVQQYLKPGGATPQEKTQQIRLGLDHAVELGLFYLDRWRLAEADDLFNRLAAAGEKENVPPYQKLGRLGHAIVLGLQDRPAESNKLFLELAGGAERDKLQQASWLRQNPRLHVWMARALGHNQENAPRDFPNDLKPLLTPAGLPKRGPDKPAGGGKGP